MESSNLVKQDVSCVSDGQQLLNGCLHCMDQCEELIDKLSASDYASCSEGASSIGGHIRHILERFHSFFNGLPEESINYDARKRDKAIETNLDSAHFAIASVSRRLQELELDRIHGKTITVRETVYHHGESVEITSTIERELMGLVTHSIHHLAIISLLAKHFGHQMDQSFGKAPSTIVFERS